jgi:hypothetical protein
LPETASTKPSTNPATVSCSGNTSSIQEECFTSPTRTSIYSYCGEEISGGRYYSGLGIAAGANIYGLISAISRASDINSGKISALERLRFTVPTKKGGLKVAYNFNF